jgi:tetratricopeptide (TPR) repeat protein
MPLAQAESHAERVERLFHETLEIEAGSRDAFLTGVCGGNEPLRLAVRRLVDASARVARKPGWSEPAIQNEALRAAAPTCDTTLERYRLIEPIGSGGMGLVYKAVRADDEFSKLVAIKIVQHGVGDASHDAIVRRFRQERQILAGLEHPNIAHLLDGGSTPDGLPFLVMDYVDGVPIDRYLAANNPTLHELLELFRTVCSAVSHAHRNLVVHRDLKPGNILVTAAGMPKLLDFGIAKLLDGSAESTLTGARAMTPEYASPEQVRGAAISTATDVYSLGVLLYELLCGVRPYRLTNSTMELAQAICTETPQPMSEHRTGKRLGTDLDNIVQMALRKEPERRYASVEQFSEDLRRYMEGYPVAARAATRGYRARKFVGRNKVSIAAAALVLLTLLGGIAATAWQARLANQRFEDVRELANAYLFEFHDAIKDLPGSTPARQLVVKRGLQYLDRLAVQRGNDSALARDLANAYEKVGDVQGAPNFPSLGDRAGALASYRKALAIREPLAAFAPQNAELGLELSNSYRRIGELLQFAGDLIGSAAILRKNVRLLEKLVAARPASVPARDALADAYAFLGNVTGNNETQNLGDTKGAMEFFQKARAIREQLVIENPTLRIERALLAADYARVAALQQALGNKEVSVAAFRQAIALNEQLIREDPVNVNFRRGAAVLYRSLALVLIRTKDLLEAQKSGDRSAQLFEQLAKEDPANMEAQEALADSYYSQGYLRAQANDWANALKHYESALAVYGSLSAKYPGILPLGLRTVYQLIADLGIKTKDTGIALRSAQKELEIDGRLLKANSANAGAQRNQGVAYTQIGQAHELMGEWREARSWYQRGLNVWIDLRKKGTLIPMYAPKMDEAIHNVARCDHALAAARSE